MKSIRRRTAVLVATSITVLLAIGGTGLAVVLRHMLTAQFDEVLAARAAALRSLTHFDGEMVEMDFTGEAMPRFAAPPAAPQRARGDDAEYFIAWVQETEHSAWRELQRSGSLAGREWPEVELLTNGTHNVPLPEHQSPASRAVIIEFTASWEDEEEKAANAQAPPPRVKVLVAASRAPLDRSLAAVAWSIAAVGGLLALGSVAVSSVAVRRGLKPLHALSTRVAAIGPTTLDARLESADLPAELRPIADQLSALLARLHAAFDREKRFAAAASHELRTPIAELRMLLEVAMSQPRSSAEWTATGERALSVLSRTQSLCESLLRVSRAESGAAGCLPAARASAWASRSAARWSKRAAEQSTPRWKITPSSRSRCSCPEVMTHPKTRDDAEE